MVKAMMPTPWLGICAVGFGSLYIKDSARVIRYLTEQQQVLTPRLMSLIMILESRRRVGISCVLEGDTGTGKTQLVSIFTHLLTRNDHLAPDFLSQVHQAFDELFFRRLPHVRPPHSLDGIVNFLENQQLETLASLASIVVGCLRQLLARHGRFVQTEGDLLHRLTDADHFVQPADAQQQENQAVLFLQNQQLVVNSLAELISLTVDMINYAPFQLFFPILVNQAMTANEIRTQVERAAKQADRVAELCHGLLTASGEPFVPPVSVFFDELNTIGNAMGLVQEVFCPHSLNGRRLPANLFVCGAINPDDDRRPGRDPSELFERISAEEMPSQFAESKTEFSVRPIPPSLRALTIQCDQFIESHCHNLAYPSQSPAAFPSIKEHQLFLSIYLDIQNRALPDKPLHLRHELDALIGFGLQFLQEANLKRNHASIRDLVRVVHLYRYFLYEPGGRALLSLGRQPGEYIDPDFKRLGCRYDAMEQAVVFPDHQPEVFLKALACAVLMAFYLRLENDIDASGTHQYHDSRRAFRQKLNERLTQPDLQMLQPQLTAEWMCETLDGRMLALFRHTAKGLGIAATRPLLENLWSTCVCLDSKTPLIIVGPAGCSKTLSFTICAENMRAGGAQKGASAAVSSSASIAAS